MRSKFSLFTSAKPLHGLYGFRSNPVLVSLYAAFLLLLQRLDRKGATCKAAPFVISLCLLS